MCAIRSANSFVTASLLLTVATLGARSSYAQIERSGGGGPNAQLYQDYQQAVSERSRLRTDNEKLKSDLADANKQLAALKKQLASAQAGTATSRAEVTAAQTGQANATRNLETLRAQAQQLVERFRQTIGTLKGVELERAQLQRDLAQSRAAFDQCALANDSLYQVNREVLDRYAHQGAFSYMARAEPFTRIERTRIENAVLEYRQRAEALRMQPRSPAGATTSASGTTVATGPGASGATQPPGGPGHNQ